MDDIQIIRLFNSRDENALRETEKKYSSYLMTIAMGILNNREDGQECLNDTYYKAWSTIPPHFPKALQLYLGKITRELSIDRWRRKHAAKRQHSEFAISLSELDECVADPTLSFEELDKKELASAINGYLKECSEDARDVFIWRYFFCDSIRSICRYTGWSESKVTSMLFRTREGLKKALLQQGWLSL